MNGTAKNRLASERGIALVLTLAILVLVTILMVGFAVSMRVENTAAKNFNDMIRARQLAQGAVDEAVALLRTNTPAMDVNNFYITQPGRAVMRGAAGATTAGSGYDLLYSIPSYAINAADTNNLNADSSIIASNSEYTTASSLPIAAYWVNLGTNGQPVGSGSGIPLIGRYSFWVDNEGTKININTANQRPAGDVLGGPLQDVTMANVLSGIGPALAASSYNYATTAGFASADHWKAVSGIAVTAYTASKSYITPYSSDADLTPWGTKKLYLNQMTQAQVDDPTTSLANPGLNNWFGQNFFNKYGTYTDYAGNLHSGDQNITKQILANLVDFPAALGNGAIACTGAGDIDAGLPGTFGIPNSYLGLRRYPFLNEIACIPTWSWVGGVRGGTLQAQLWVFVELINPYEIPWGNLGSVKIDADKLVWQVNADCSGAPCPGYPYVPPAPDSQDGNWSQELQVPIPNVPAHSYLVVTNVFTLTHAEKNTNAYVDVVEVKLNKVRLLQWADDPNPHDNTIRDWASGNDFDLYLEPAGITGSQSHFTFNGTNKVAQSTVAPPLTYVQGIAKNDPRVRTFNTWTPPLKAWYRVGDESTGNNVTINKAATLGAENSTVNYASGTGIANVPNDQPPSAGVTAANNGAIYAKTSGSSMTGTNYDSIGELGYIHTGLQWRTLMLQPRPATEAANSPPLIPDWCVLDMFTVFPTNQLVQGRININAAITNLSNTTQPRVVPLQGLLTAVTKPNSMGFSTDQALIASNIATMKWARANWATERVTSPFHFIPGVYNMIGELCEVDGVATNWSPLTAYTNDAVAEARIRSFANLVTVRSSTFSVWAHAQSIKKVDLTNPSVFNPALDLITGEVKVQAIVERYENPPGSVKFRTKFLRYFY